jgi:hypothetical protein
MSFVRTLKKLLLGETWLLPLGLAAVLLSAALVLRPLLGGAWDRSGGFVVLAGVVAVLLVSVQRGARRTR